MMAGFPRTVAKIYDFREEARRRKASSYGGGRPVLGKSYEVPAPVCGGAWYHEEAIRASDPQREG